MTLDIVTAALAGGGLFLGLILGWLVSSVRSRGIYSEILASLRTENEFLEQRLVERGGEIDDLKGQLAESGHEKDSLKAELLDLSGKNSALDEKAKILEESRRQLAETFSALSSRALKDNNRNFMELARTTFSRYIEVARKDFDAREGKLEDIVEPVKAHLEKYDEKVREMELAREKAYGTLSQQIVSITQTQQELSRETGNLVKALRVPHVRGRWGEITLKRVAELAGMTDRCDFQEQISVGSGKGSLRPDMIVHLPGGRQIVVDAKVPLAAYLEALEAPEGKEKNRMLDAHARQVQTHLSKLSAKEYWKQFENAPEFTVLFIPGENFFSAALSRKPDLIEEGVSKGVILATPTTFISLLKAVSYGWRKNQADENAEEISRLGRELYERLGAMAEHILRVGADLERCSASYNRMVGSMERRVLVSARKFGNLGISLKDGKEPHLPEGLEN